MLSRYKNRHFINLGLFCHVKILIYPPYINDFRVATLLNYTKIFTNVFKWTEVRTIPKCKKTFAFCEEYVLFLIC